MLWVNTRKLVLKTNITVFELFHSVQNGRLTIEDDRNLDNRNTA